MRDQAQGTKQAAHQAILPGNHRPSHEIVDSFPDMKVAIIPALIMGSPSAVLTVAPAKRFEAPVSLSDCRIPASDGAARLALGQGCGVAAHSQHENCFHN